MDKETIIFNLRKTAYTFLNVLPIIIGMLLLTSLALAAFPEAISAKLFGRGELLDAVVGAVVGGIAAGHPLASYIVGGELLATGVSLIAVAALIVSWVTVGVVQLPAEGLLLGRRFAIYRNLICFFCAIAVAFCSVYTLRLLN